MHIKIEHTHTKKRKNKRKQNKPNKYLKKAHTATNRSDVITK